MEQRVRLNLGLFVFLKQTDKPDDGTDIYVGSTSQTLKNRLRIHRSDALRLGNESNKLYKRMREVGIYNWQVVPLLTFTCDKKTILEFEREWCNVLNADLNTLLPVLSPDEKKGYNANYYESNRVTIRQQQANYYGSNRETIRQKQTQYYQSNIQSKAHHCDVCDKSFGSNKDLRKHFGTLKHQCAYLNSLD